MSRALLNRVGRALALTTVFTILVWLPAAPAGADLADGDTTTTTLPSDPTTTTTEPFETTTTTTAPPEPDPDADADSDTSTTSTSTRPTTTSRPVRSTSTTLASSGPPGGSGPSTTTSRPSPTTTATAPTATTAPNPASPPAGATMITDAAGDPPASGDDPGTGGGAATPSAGSGRTPRPSASEPDSKRSETGDEEVPDPNWFDASGLSGLLGVGSGLPPAAADVATPAGDLQLAAALPSRDGNSPSPVLLALSLLIMLGLAGGVAYLWWDRRPTRYWAA